MFVPARGILASFARWFDVVKDRRDLGIMLIFPCILVVGLVVRFILWVVGLDLNLIDMPLVSRKGVLNRYFAGHSFQLFALEFSIITAYLLFFKSETIKYSDSASLLPVTERDLRATTTKKQVLAKQVLKLVLVFAWINILIVWFFGDSIFGWFLKFTGGKCSNGNGSLSYHQCLADDDNTWVGGVKLSGHSLILSCFSTVSIFELLMVRKVHLRNRLEGVLNTRHNVSSIAYKVILIMVCAVVLIWMAMFSITAVFYHTVPEKIVGLACGLAPSYVVYFRFRDYFNILK